VTANRINPNPDWTEATADELAVREHPLVRALPLPAKGTPPAKLVLEPAKPPLAPSRFLHVHAPPDWRSEPAHRLLPRGNGIGRGCGFRKLAERPIVYQDTAKPAQQPQLLESNGYLVVSPEVRDVFCRYDASAVEFCEIEWQYRDGTRLEGYGLLDVINLLSAYDYARSKIAVSVYPNGATYILLVPPTTLRADIAPEIHFFREERWRWMYCSLELAAELAPFAGSDLAFTDPMTGNAVIQFGEPKEKSARTPAPLPAIVHEVPSASKFSRPLLQIRMYTEIRRLLEAGDFTAAEANLVESLRALPESPLHVAIAPGVAITTPAANVAAYLDTFWKKALEQGEPKVLYAEMNAFTINPDAWFFDLCAFIEDGGSESFDWLGDFYTSTDRHCLIEGMEPLQAVYGRRDREPGLLRGHDDARMLVEALVIIRFQRLLQEALGQAKCDVRLLASAHDRADRIVAIKPITA
jgi:hypothetical protein